MTTTKRGAAGRGEDAWEQGAGWVLVVLAGTGALVGLAEVAAAAPVLLVPPVAGAYGLWRWHRHTLASRARAAAEAPPSSP